MNWSHTFAEEILSEKLRSLFSVEKVRQKNIQTMKIKKKKKKKKKKRKKTLTNTYL